MAQMGSVAKMICVLDGDTVPCARTCIKATKIGQLSSRQTVHEQGPGAAKADFAGGGL